LYSVSYNLAEPDKDYKALYDELERLGGHRLLPSQWGMRSNGPAAALRDHLTPYIDAIDRLLVVQIDGTEWASWNALHDINKL
jgi:hypothetical protein